MGATGRETALSASLRASSGALVALILLGLTTPGAGYAASAVTGLSHPNIPVDHGKRLSLLLGWSYGQDSNILRDEAASVSDDFQQGHVGLIFMSGLPYNGIEVRYDGQFVQHAVETAYDHFEQRLNGSYFRETERFRFLLSGGYEHLADPQELEAPSGTMRRQRFLLGPSLDLKLGRTDVVVGANATLSSYTVSARDHDDMFLKTELRYWSAETRHLFIHFDQGEISYGDPGKSAFSYNRIYTGLRSEVSERSSLEVAVGMQGRDVTGFAPETEELFVSARTTRMLMRGRSSLTLGVSMGSEASMVSDFKTVNRFTGQYAHAANTRLSYTLGVEYSSATFGNRDELVVAPDDLTYIAADVGLMLQIGSPRRLNGRLFATYGFENRSWTGAAPYPDYDRTRLMAGLALVH